MQLTERQEQVQGVTRSLWGQLHARGSVRNGLAVYTQKLLRVDEAFKTTSR